MPNHFASIGFPVNSPGELQTLVRSVQARTVPTSIGGQYLFYATPEGCELWAQLDPDGRLIGCHPHFSGPSRYRVNVGRVRSDGPTPLDGTLVGQVAEGQVDVPVVIDVPDFRRSEARLQPAVRAVLQVAAFPYELGVFPSEEAFRGSRFGQLNPDGALIPSGSCEPGGGAIEPPRPTAILAGRIRSVRQLANSQTHRPFYALEVQTLGGTVDVVATPEEVGGQPQVNGIVAGSFHLSGRLIEPLPADARPPQALPVAGPVARPRGDDFAAAIRQAYLGCLRSPAFGQYFGKVNRPPKWRFVLAGLFAVSIVGIPVAIGLLISALLDLHRRRQAKESLAQRVQRMVPVRTRALMVNSVLRERPGSIAPGLVIGSLGPQAAGDLGLMESMAESILQQAEQILMAEPKDEDERQLVALLADTRYTPNRRRRIPTRFTGGREVYAFDLLIIGSFLPDGTVEQPVIYCLADPGPAGEIHMLPHAVAEAIWPR